MSREKLNVVSYINSASKRVILFVDSTEKNYSPFGDVIYRGQIPTNDSITRPHEAIKDIFSYLHEKGFNGTYSIERRTSQDTRNGDRTTVIFGTLLYNDRIFLKQLLKQYIKKSSSRNISSIFKFIGRDGSKLEKVAAESSPVPE
ncbi:hypothetical protein CO154_00870 [Candidatus Pacearchaeota archaeon CG_4_9_14_3_um_filter_31_7]|nr:MAG: hypothetical protein AUJ10_02815 [Candidatus Pacearchaeota archaeon CG1_02_31_27]PIN92095.1 MAG: hypothetical protein COU55_02825 [Candidatus Pacearchaeota archaeon CG10_big_fil_rev_8_21_14_0_10_31_59]PIZ80310.1 MAG: hypothetical protein COX99_02930 [Candidatus Pacearchaeota archaeon CG_4_10_14_0_2_um_filter_31_10]PJA70826.1 MAG: hypothetical protein CO154_00870 [Candidatus Pacearchaeota archaeon CG_4_9_14_3_um_filter_31_7]